MALAVPVLAVSQTLTITTSTVTFDPGIIAGKSYACTFWAYSPAGYASLSAAIDWRDSTGTYISTSAANAAIAAGKAYVG